MSVSKKNILIVGAGQLGSRYLQGLAKCVRPLKIYVLDVYRPSLEQAKQRWIDVSGNHTKHEVLFTTELDLLPSEFDLVIVATTADVRPRAMEKVVAHATVRFWILEKVLAQSQAAIDAIIQSAATSSGAWVNTPRRMMPWYKQIGAQLGLNGPVSLKLEGGLWGLACNSIHMLDLFSWLTGEALSEINTSLLSPNWFESKRKGSWEISGVLEARFSGGSSAFLAARDGVCSENIWLGDGSLSWSIKENEGIAIRSDGLEIFGRILYQSEITASLVDTILNEGSCDLPTLTESAVMHRVFIEGMLNHWRKSHDCSSAPFIPIT